MLEYLVLVEALFPPVQDLVEYIRTLIAAISTFVVRVISIGRPRIDIGVNTWWKVDLESRI